MSTARRRVYLRWAVYALAVAVVLYLALVAAYPSLLDRLHRWTGWFGTSGSVATIVVACAIYRVGLPGGLAGHGLGHGSVGRPSG